MITFRFFHISTRVYSIFTISLLLPAVVHASRKISLRAS